MFLVLPRNGRQNGKKPDQSGAILIQTILEFTWHSDQLSSLSGSNRMQTEMVSCIVRKINSIEWSSLANQSFLNQVTDNRMPIISFLKSIRLPIIFIYNFQSFVKDSQTHIFGDMAFPSTGFCPHPFCIERPGWRPRMFRVFARTSGLSSTRDDLGESG